MRLRALIAILLAISTLVACGTKGPLYLPKKGTATPAQPAPDPANSPVPPPESKSDKPAN